MKRTLLSFLSISIFLGFITVAFLSQPAQSYSSGAPPSSSGAPGDLGTCIQCHGAQVTEKPDWVTSSVPTTGFDYNTLYTFNASATHNGAAMIGFQASVEDPTKTKAGNLLVTDAVRTQIIGTNFITHTLAGTTPTNNSNSWSFSWLSPPSANPYVAMYVCFNAADGNGLATNDKLYKTIVPLFHSSTAGLLTNTAAQHYKVYPNPATDFLNLETGDSGPVMYSLTNLSGNVVCSGLVSRSGQIHVSGTAPGIYFLTIDGEDGLYSRKIVIR